MSNRLNEADFETMVSAFSPAVRGLVRGARRLLLDVLPEAFEVVWGHQKTAGYGTGPKKMTEHFCWVGAAKEYGQIGFFYGSELPDPAKLLEGTGARMRHVKIRSEADLKSPALRRLVEIAVTHRVPPPRPLGAEPGLEGANMGLVKPAGQEKETKTVAGSKKVTSVEATGSVAGAKKAAKAGATGAGAQAGAHAETTKGVGKAEGATAGAPAKATKAGAKVTKAADKAPAKATGAAGKAPFAGARRASEGWAARVAKATRAVAKRLAARAAKGEAKGPATKGEVKGSAAKAAKGSTAKAAKGPAANAAGGGAKGPGAEGAKGGAKGPAAKGAEGAAKGPAAKGAEGAAKGPAAEGAKGARAARAKK